MKKLNILADKGEAELKLIQDFEKANHIKLPKSYINLMLKHNEPYFNENNFNYLDIDGDEIRCSLGFCGFGELAVDNINYFQINDNDEYNNQGLIVFGLDGGGYYICFDYRKNPSTDNPPVVIEYNNGDTYIDKDGQDKFLVFSVAKDFDDFLNMLYE